MKDKATMSFFSVLDQRTLDLGRALPKMPSALIGLLPTSKKISGEKTNIPEKQVYFRR